MRKLRLGEIEHFFLRFSFLAAEDRFIKMILHGYPGLPIVGGK